MREVLRGLAGRLRLLRELPRFDAVFLHREAAPVGPPVIERLMAKRQVPVVYDFDDSIYLPNASDANRVFAPLKWVRKVGAICALSHHVTVGNDHLRHFAERHADEVSACRRRSTWSDSCRAVRTMPAAPWWSAGWAARARFRIS
jgi:hypothetical protein